MIKVRNVNRYAMNFKYIIARYLDSQWWFYGAWNDYNDAAEAALDLNYRSHCAGYWAFALENCECEWRD